MPELPEVETYRQGLNGLVQGKTIENVSVSWPNIIETDLDIDSWCQQLNGQTIKDVKRRAKFLIFELTDWDLISHLRMEGKYYFYEKGEVENNPKIKKHTHVKFYFTDGTQLHYNDVRKFGRMELVKPSQLDEYWKSKKLGPEPDSPEFTPDYLYNYFKGRKTNIKASLLSQEPVVGLGNIYVDEVLFRSKVHPASVSGLIPKEQVTLIHHNTKEVLKEAIEAGGTTIRSYLNALGEAGSFQVNLNVYGRQGEPCPNCGTPIKKIRIAQRGTHFCPNCQILYGAD